MSEATRTRRRRTGPTKAEQDKAQREAKAAEAAAEAPAEETPAEAPAEETPAVTPADGDAVAAEDEKPTGAFGPLPKINAGGTTRTSAWTDRLNGVAEHQAAADAAEAELAKAEKRDPEPQYAWVHQTGSSDTATSVASDVRKRVKEGRIGGLVGGGSFELITRGRRIYARFVPTEQ